MIRFVHGDGIARAARRMVDGVEERLRSWGVADASGDVVVAVGADDARLAALAGPGPRVLVPAVSSRAAPAWSSALVAAAAGIVVFDVRELAALPHPLVAPVVVAGLPRATETAPGQGVDTGAAPVDLVALWGIEGRVPPGAPGVAWVGGGVLPALCAAAEAWAARRAVVVLPGTRPHPLLHGAALVARTSLEVIEATRYLCENRPLARALADAGRRRTSDLEDPDEVARRTAEAIILAGG